jgi:hypothetical protein
MEPKTARSARQENSSVALADLVLRHQSAWLVLSGWESMLLGKRLAATALDRPVFISGLARAGTTVLLRKLCELPEFAAHRYSDFPFLFTPYAWAKLRSLAPPSRQLPRERMHRDGIMVTAESPEAMEEVLWMAFFPYLHDPTASSVLDDQVRQPEFESFLADHMRKLILARGSRRYLSKNNYNLTRLSYLGRLFPDARFLIPIRAPVAHVASLLKQHRLFCEVQRENEAARRHLRLVGHFEFGLDRRPINPSNREAVAVIEDCWARREEVRGWAKYWALVYRYVAERLEADPPFARRCLLVRYEDLCDRAPETMAAIGEHIGSPPAGTQSLARGLHQPDYYRITFTGAERTAIDEETSDVAARFGYHSAVSW